ncbi:Flp family type IVb pilin [Nocardioides euryhalodurans]|uniref:Flp family type IVb pilin n=1 Tax=Nocardioides euryhalodurans TaxID=2518370 RepID=A0A4P7GPM4_9ACTN|nr:Flp family type IVb pilin [Nocardioides euryhalodurans]QBR94196.1 Flp family type IVb pilin [Nocardioides euryhalodurans]
MTGREQRDERGASAVEYGLLIAGIALIIFAVVFVFGGGVDGLLKGSCDTINQEITAADC